MYQSNKLMWVLDKDGAWNFTSKMSQSVVQNSDCTSIWTAFETKR